MINNTTIKGEKHEQEQLHRGGLSVPHGCRSGYKGTAAIRQMSMWSAGDRMKLWGKTGAFWGGLWGLLFGSAFFWIPGLGPLLVAGPLVSWIVGALEGAIAVGGLSAIGAGLYSLGIPKDSILQYETALKTDKFVLIAHGSTDDMTHAKEILNHTKPDTLDHHQ